MNLGGVLYGLGSVPMFASRPFLAALVTSLLARFGGALPLLGGSSLVQSLEATPGWFSSWTALGVLALLALGEALSGKSPEVRAVMQELDTWLRSGTALAVSLALFDSETAETLQAVQHAGLTPASVLALVIGALVHGFALLRRAFLSVVLDADEDDDVGLVSVVSWAENSWTVLGILFLVLFPIAAVVLGLLTALALRVLAKRAERRAEESKVPCASCGARLHASAPRCRSCGAAVAAPRAIGVFGAPREAPAPEPAEHRFRLIARKRCPVCAERLRARAPKQACPTCGATTFASDAELASYLGALRARLPRTLLVCLGLGAVPILGVVPGVVYFRLNLVSGLRGYIPPLRGIGARWTVRILSWGILALQPIPVLGALVLPAMCWANWLVYGRALRRQGERALSVAPLAAARAARP